LGWLVGRAQSNPGWDSPPIVDLMSFALHGFDGKFGDLPQLARVLRADRPALGLHAASAHVIRKRLFTIDIRGEACRRLRMWPLSFVNALIYGGVLRAL
jgi:hypothetical protein